MRPKSSSLPFLPGALHVISLPTYCERCNSQNVKINMLKDEAWLNPKGRNVLEIASCRTLERIILTEPLPLFFQHFWSVLVFRYLIFLTLFCKRRYGNAEMSSILIQLFSFLNLKMF